MKTREFKKNRERQFNIRLSAAVKRFRLSRGEKARFFAQILDVDEVSYHNAENGKRKFTYYEILYLNHLLGFPLDNLNLLD